MSPGQPTITVTVVTGRGDRSYTFPQSTKVADVIAQAVGDFGFESNGSYVLVRDTGNEELGPERPLVSYHIENGETLTLTAIGSGVCPSIPA
jgi:hypothetical protein